MFHSNKTTAVLLFTMLLPALAGFALLTEYSQRPGPTTRTLMRLPDEFFAEENSIAKAGPTVLIFYHPKCPCTFATARCMERIVTRLANAPTIHAFAFCPQGKPEDWTNSRSTAKFKAVGATIQADDGSIHRRFGVSTSGHILVFDSGRELTFSGGITSSRGHEGSCQASAHFERSIQGESIEFSAWPVYGCLTIPMNEARND